VILSGVTGAIRHGRVTAVMGPSGAGACAGTSHRVFGVRCAWFGVDGPDWRPELGRVWRVYCASVRGCWASVVCLPALVLHARVCACTARANVRCAVCALFVLIDVRAGKSTFVTTLAGKATYGRIRRASPVPHLRCGSLAPQHRRAHTLPVCRMCVGTACVLVLYRHSDRPCVHQRRGATAEGVPQLGGICAAGAWAQVRVDAGPVHQRTRGVRLRAPGATG
jgi:hypothetical protein